MATSKKDLIGKTIGQWYILEEVGRNSSYSQLYKARCTRCGYITEHATVQTLKKDIPCMQHIKTKWPNQRLKTIFENMHARCYYHGNARYNRYGGRGITICDEWLYDRNKFVKWALENGYADNLTIDRIDNDGNYTPDNCRWVTKTVNNQNRPFVGKYEYNGTNYTLPELSKLFTGSPTKFEDYRKYYGHKAMLELIDQYKANPNMEFPNRVKRIITVNGISKSLSDWDRYLGTYDTHYIGDYAKKPNVTDEMVIERIRGILDGTIERKSRTKKYYFDIHGYICSAEDIVKLTPAFKYSRSVVKRVDRDGFTECESYLNMLIPVNACEELFGENGLELY